MPITDPPPTPAPKADTDKQTKAQTAEFKGAVADARSAIADAWGDVKALVEAGKSCNLVVLTAAIDDQTKAIGDITSHGSEYSSLPHEEAKALRDAHTKLTQAYSDLRTIVEFGSSDANLPEVIASMDAAVSGVATAHKS